MKISDYSKDAIKTKPRIEEEQGENGEWAKNYLFWALSQKSGEIQKIYHLATRLHLDIKDYRDKALVSVGDLLWYLNAVCKELGVDLEEAARKNLELINDRYHEVKTVPWYKGGYKDNEYFSERYEFLLIEEACQGIKKLSIFLIKEGDKNVEQKFGDEIDDNEYEEDWYRLHDILHFAFLAYLGWSPVIRKLLGNKRKSHPDIDRVEDGAKARDLEEAMSLLIWRYMEKHKMLENDVGYVETSFIQHLIEISEGREVSKVSPYVWEICILEAARAIREARELLKEEKSVIVRISLHKEKEDGTIESSPNISVSPFNP